MWHIPRRSESGKPQFGHAMKFCLLGALGLALVSRAEGHGSLLYPLPRGGVDRDLAPFKTGGFPKGHYPCTCTNGTEAECRPAQSCLWFNQVRPLPVLHTAHAGDALAFVSPPNIRLDATWLCPLPGRVAQYIAPAPATAR